MEKTKIVSLATNTGFATVFAFTFFNELSMVSLDSNVFNQVYLGLTIAAVAINFISLLFVLRQFQKGSTVEYDDYYIKKSQIFSLFGLFFCMLDSTIFALVVKGNDTLKHMLPLLCFLGLLFLSVSRHYQHTARKKTRRFTSVGTTLTFFQLMGVLALCDLMFPDMLPSFEQQKNIIISLLGVSFFCSLGLIIKDTFNIPLAQKKDPESIRQDIPRDFPYKVSPGLKWQIYQELSEENFNFFKSTNAFYYAYIRDKGHLTPDVINKLKYIYTTFILKQSNQSEQDNSPFSKEALSVYNLNYINIGYRLRKNAKTIYSNFLTDQSEHKADLLENLNAIYQEMCSLLNKDTQQRYRHSTAIFAKYVWIVLPSIGFVLGGGIGYTIQYYALQNDLMTLTGCMVGWLIGYGIGEMISHGDNRFANACKDNMKAWDAKCN